LLEHAPQMATEPEPVLPVPEPVLVPVPVVADVDVVALVVPWVVPAPGVLPQPAKQKPISPISPMRRAGDELM
jgi:hypothetical protein